MQVIGREAAESVTGIPEQMREAALQLRSEHHFFAIAANKLIEHRKWVADHGLCQNVDFAEIDAFPSHDIRDLRNMREHIKDYFSGKGRDADRWIVKTPEYSGDASASAGTIIGGRLDWAKFAPAAERLLHRLFAEPIPFPPPRQPCEGSRR
jgi:hypothetical protein